MSNPKSGPETGQRICRCGQHFRVSEALSARCFCPRCGAEQFAAGTTAPAPAAAAVISPARAPATARLESEGGLPRLPRAERATLSHGGVRHPRLRPILYVVGSVAVGVTVLGFIFGLMFPWMWLLLVPAIAATWFFLGRAVWRLFRSLSEVLEKKDMLILQGLIRLIAWDPAEGVIILKHKALLLVDDDMTDGGGVQLLIPMLGEELAIRVPLEIQTLRFHDNNVLTREYVPLAIKGTVYWRIVDLERFYLFVSKEIHHATDFRPKAVASATQDVAGDAHLVEKARSNQQLASACEWLRSLSEEQTREVVAGASTGLLFADRIAESIPAAGGDPIQMSEAEHRPESPESYKRATDGLTKSIHDAVSKRVARYGIDIHEVSLQEVEMPAEIKAGAIQACQSVYTLMEKRRGAIGRRIELEAERSVLGQEGLVMKEVVSNTKGMGAGVMLAGVLEEFFAKSVQNRREAGAKHQLPDGDPKRLSGPD